MEHPLSRLHHIQQNHGVGKAELGSTSPGWMEIGDEYSIIKQISAHLHQYSVVIKDDSVVGNYHDDHQGSGRHGDGILLLHCSFSPI